MGGENIMRTAFYKTDKSIFNFKVQYKDGITIDLHNINLWVESFQIFSPPPEHDTDSSIKGRHGSVYYGTTLKDRKVSATISIEAVDFVDFDLLRDKIFRIFNPLQKFYIIRDLQPSKRMEVSVDNDFNIDYTTLEDGEFTIDFVIHSVFLESIGTTRSHFTTSSNLWQAGQGLKAEKLEYMHRTTSFKIYNAGDIEINPRQMPLLIQFRGSSKNLTIKNKTTGDEWSYTGTTTGDSVTGEYIKLQGVWALKGTTSIFSQTNYKLIKLAPGWNEFELTGVTGDFYIFFDFRFYYF